ncbi:MAG: hypothetical protein U0353_14635 [Sandaracinus sp.]
MLASSRVGARRAMAHVAATALALTLVACGARTGTEDDPHREGVLPPLGPEVCNGLDDDGDGLLAVGVLDGGARDAGDAAGPDAGPRDAAVLDDAGMDGGSLDAGGLDAGSFDAGRMDAGRMDAGRMDAGMDLDLRVDEDFRDSLGRYIVDAHCGACGSACRPSRPHELETHCGLVAESPTCMATRCDPGFTPSRTGRCVPIHERLCLSCADDGDCGDFVGAACDDVGGEQRCTIDCALGCPDGYACREGVCAPESGSCTCEAGDDFALACALHDPEGNRCAGTAACRDGVLSACTAPADVCDEVDNDCNGVIDDPYRDARGAYILDIHNCGECGVDCTLSRIPEGDLVCGGDPFAPSCVLRCPDTEDGIMPGDRIDADRDIATGCECTVSSLDDQPGPVRTSGEMLDVNCDGADGIVVESLYVAPDGDDAGPGSPTRPMRTVEAAIARASMSIGTPMPRTHVFVASGTYTESVELRDGVRVHGGYRRDFLALDPDGFRVEIRAPVGTTAPGQAAVVIRGAGTSETVLEWLTVRGLDATMASQATFGIYALDPGPRLSIRECEIRAGVGGAGTAGVDGTAGTSFTTLPTEGEDPRGAEEDVTHACIGGVDRNRVLGGRGGQNSCGGVDVSGGDGGTAGCPMFAAFQASGSVGRSAGATVGGEGGSGGQDSQGPITRETGTCSTDVCCGLADFSVPTDFTGPQPGRPGAGGRNGTAGGACSEPFGRFVGDAWMGVAPTAGTTGTPGAGGGGGGAGGGAQMEWFSFTCEFADGLGGGGGGGGAGGCGGTPGTPGTSGAPSVAILVRYSSPEMASRGLFDLRASLLAPSDGGSGGDGGAGGDGGRGANGAFGGSLLRSERSTPTLSGPFAGGRGGAGGNGGAGGGAGGGCGGYSAGVWFTGISSEPMGVAGWRTNNTFALGQGGRAGRGGGGAAPGPRGAAGMSVDVVVR